MSAAKNNCSYAHVKNHLSTDSLKKYHQTQHHLLMARRRILSILVDKAFMEDELFFFFLSSGQDNWEDLMVHCCLCKPIQFSKPAEVCSF